MYNLLKKVLPVLAIGLIGFSPVEVRANVRDSLALGVVQNSLDMDGDSEGGVILWPEIWPASVQNGEFVMIPVFYHDNPNAAAIRFAIEGVPSGGGFIANDTANIFTNTDNIFMLRTGAWGLDDLFGYIGFEVNAYAGTQFDISIVNIQIYDWEGEVHTEGLYGGSITLTVSPYPGLGPYGPFGRVRGDVDGDGIVTVVDALQIAEVVFGIRDAYTWERHPWFEEVLGEELSFNEGYEYIVPTWGYGQFGRVRGDVTGNEMVTMADVTQVMQVVVGQRDATTWLPMTSGFVNQEYIYPYTENSSLDRIEPYSEDGVRVMLYTSQHQIYGHEMARVYVYYYDNPNVSAVQFSVRGVFNSWSHFHHYNLNFVINPMHGATSIVAGAELGNNMNVVGNNIAVLDLNPARGRVLLGYIDIDFSGIIHQDDSFYLEIFDIVSDWNGYVHTGVNHGSYIVLHVLPELVDDDDDEPEPESELPPLDPAQQAVLDMLQRVKEDLYNSFRGRSIAPLATAEIGRVSQLGLSDLAIASLQVMLYSIPHSQMLSGDFDFDAWLEEFIIVMDIYAYIVTNGNLPQETYENRDILNQINNVYRGDAQDLAYQQLLVINSLRSVADELLRMGNYERAEMINSLADSLYLTFRRG